MSRVINIIESKVIERSGHELQRVIFSDDKIVYVNIDTGEVKPDSTPDKYVDLISLYNSTHHTTAFNPRIDNAEPESNGLRKAAAVIDVVLVFIIGYVGILALSNGGWFIIALAWTIPMTVMATHAVADGKQHIGLGVCHLLFFNIISGILILVSNGQIEQEHRSGS